MNYVFEGRFIDEDLAKRDPAQEGALGPDGALQVLPYSFWEQFNRAEIGKFCVLHGIYCIPTVELVAWLKEAIGDAKAIEIGSGNGVLASALGIIGTDSKMQDRADMKQLYADIGQATVRYGAHVRPMDAEKAVRAFRPKVVICAWVTHRYREEEHWREGNMHGVYEERIVEKAKYIAVCNRHVHRHKPILELEHEEYDFPWLVSRGAVNGTPDYIAVWKKGAKRR